MREEERRWRGGRERRERKKLEERHERERKRGTAAAIAN